MQTIQKPPMPPIYEYRCGGCGAQVEVLQRWDAPPPGGCERCGGEMARQVSAPTFRLKGGGWYETDFKSGSGRNLADGGEHGAAKDAKAGDTGSPGDKPAAGNSGAQGEKPAAKPTPESAAKPAAGGS